MNIDIAPLLDHFVLVTTESWRTMGSGGGLYGFVATGKLRLDFPTDEEEGVYLLTEVGFSLSFRASAVVDVITKSDPPTIVLKTTP